MTLVSKLEKNTNKDSHPDPIDTPLPQGVHVCVRPLEVESKTAGGIILPGSDTEDWTRLTTVGRVISISPVAYDEDVHREPWFKVGDHVLWAKHAGVRMRVKNEHGDKILLSFIPYEQIIATVPNLETLDTGSHKILEI